MRKVLLILFLTAINIPTVAQKGSTLLYGNLYYQYFENSPYGLGVGSNLSINPGVGYAFSNRWTAGLNVSFGFMNNNNLHHRSYHGGPFVRYTHPLSEIFSVYGQFETSYGIYKDEGSEDGNIFFAGLFPAVELNIKNGFALNFSFGGINYIRTTTSGLAGIGTSFTVHFGSGLNFGVSKRFSRK